MTLVAQHIHEPFRRIVTPVGKGAVVNLDQEARDWHRLVRGGDDSINVLLNPETCGEFVRWVAQRHSADWTWGGYLEDRSYLWRGSALPGMPSVLHAGIDINLPAHTPVRAGVRGQVLHVDRDPPEPAGWGSSLVVLPDANPEFVLLYAHLGKLLVREGERVGVGSLLGELGVPVENGNWFPHLHLQVVRTDFYEREKKADFPELDGYFRPAELERFRALYPDPIEFLKRTN